MLGAVEWIWIVIVAIFWIIQAFTRKREEEPQQPLPMPRKPQNRPRPQQPYGSPPASPAPRHEETAPTPEQQIRNFLQELQRRMAEQQQQARATPPPPPPQPQPPELEPAAEALIEQPIEPVETEITEAELASQAASQAYTLPAEEPAPARRRLAFDRNSIRTAFIMREVLGSPRALAPYEREA